MQIHEPPAPVYQDRTFGSQAWITKQKYDSSHTNRIIINEGWRSDISFLRQVTGSRAAK